jgi:hypothetical protein
MSSIWFHSEVTNAGGQNQDFADLEKGLYSNTQSLEVLPPLAQVNQKTQIPMETLLSPISPIYEGITPSSSVPVLSLSCHTKGQGTNATAPDLAAKEHRWIVFQLWFNTYRKFFTFVTLLNLTGIIMTALGRFPYAENHLGALVLGNLLCAILMRNELFLRFLYTIAIYGLRSVRLVLYNSHDGR